jgi:hypothetical protein
VKIALLAVLILSGCTKSQQPLLQLTMFGDNQSALYVVQQNGDIAFGGGMHAIQGKTSWKGALTPQQLEKLQVLLEATPLQATDKKLTYSFQIKSQVGDVASKATVALSNVHATELYFFLEESTLSRVQSQLNALPKPSMDVIADREMKDIPQ